MSGMTGGEFYWLWPKKMNAGVFERFEITKKNK